MSDAARQIDQDEYDAIEEAVLASPKGRWFLEEYARRNRFANTEDVILAIERLYDLARETSANTRFGFLNEIFSVFQHNAHTFVLTTIHANQITNLNFSHTVSYVY